MSNSNFKLLLLLLLLLHIYMKLSFSNSALKDLQNSFNLIHDTSIKHFLGHSAPLKTEVPCPHNITQYTYVALVSAKCVISPIPCC
jgi:hypothetical protein